MAAVNKACLLGRLGRDPDVKFTQGGQAVANFSVAINNKWKDQTTGDPKEHTEWVNVVAWGALAETCGKHLQKGSQVYVEGPIQTQQYEREGVMRYFTKVKAFTVQILTWPGNAAEGGAPSRGAPSSPAPLPADDDIPF